MGWRFILLPVVAAVLGGVFLAAQLHTREITLNTERISPSTAGDYIGQARAEAPQLHAAGDLQLVRVGVALCTAIGRVPGQEAAPSAVEGLTPDELYAVTDAATRHLCPEQRAKVAGYLRAAR
ncbi:hypothetical protein [Actinomadura geliboluensis]|uniref:hypothetical protein n=1 Tax=Actinomadura geliboluensis TaxID=882440 RepID=UPI00368FBF33